MDSFWQTVGVFAPVAGWLLAFVVGAAADAAACRHSSIPLLVAARPSQATRGGTEATLYFLKAAFGAVTMLYLAAAVAVAIYAAAVIHAALGIGWLAACCAVSAIIGVVLHAMEIDATTNRLLTGSGVYTRWPELERAKDRLVGLGAATSFLYVCAVTSLVIGGTDWAAAAIGRPELDRVWAFDRLEGLVIATAILFAAGVIMLNIVHRSPAATVPATVEPLVTQTAAGITIVVGAAYSIQIAAVYGGALLALGDWRFSGVRLALSTESLASAAPLLAGLAVGLFRRVNSVAGSADREAVVESLPATKAVATFTVLTYNTAQLTLPAWLQKRAGTPPYCAERIAALPTVLRQSGADVIALQEVFGRSRKSVIAAALVDTYPYAFWGPTLPSLRFDAGLLVLSRFPIVAGAYHPFVAAGADERWVIQRGYLSVAVDLGAELVARVVTYHLVAGRTPEAPEVDAVRERQISQLLAHADATPEPLVVLMGDLNAGYGVDKADRSRAVGVSRGNYDYVLAHRAAGHAEPTYIDTMRLFAPERAVADTITWDSQGVLARDGVHSFQHPQTIDHVFIRRDGLARISAGTVDRLFDEASVHITSSLSVPVSDHSAVRVNLKFRGGQ
ncbi:MAG: endonuclease/exonuclease/phosphatase family protein [Alphaproteobacteria bacterium]